MIWLDIKYFMLLMTGRIEKPDVIFTRTFFSLGTHLASRLYDLPVLREVHADFLEEAGILFRGRPLLLWLSKLQSAWSQFFLRRSSGLIFNHPLLQQHFEKKHHFKTPSISAYNGADTDSFHPVPRKEALQTLNLPTDKEYLLFLGSVSPWHGVEYVIEMFLQLRERRPDTELLIVGGTSSGVAKALQERCSGLEDIRFMGRVNSSEAVHYINAATACLLPVKKNRVSPGSPIKLFDYIACGKPVISQEDTVGYSDLVEGYGLGISCDFTDSIASSQAVDKFLDGIEPEHYRIHNRRVAETELNWSQTINQWLSFANELKRSP